MPIDKQLKQNSISVMYLLVSPVMYYVPSSVMYYVVWRCLITTQYSIYLFILNNNFHLKKAEKYKRDVHHQLRTKPDTKPWTRTTKPTNKRIHMKPKKRKKGHQGSYCCSSSRATFVHLKRIRSIKKPLKIERIKVQEATKNLALPTTICNGKGQPSKHLAFLSFQGDQILAIKENLHILFPLFDTTIRL